MEKKINMLEIANDEVEKMKFDFSMCTNCGMGHEFLDGNFLLLLLLECEQEIRWLKEAGFDAVVKKYKGNTVLFLFVVLSSKGAFLWDDLKTDR